MSETSTIKVTVLLHLLALLLSDVWKLKKTFTAYKIIIYNKLSIFLP